MLKDNYQEFNLGLQKKTTPGLADDTINQPRFFLNQSVLVFGQYDANRIK